MDNTQAPSADVEFMDSDIYDPSPAVESSPRIEVGETRTVSKESRNTDSNQTKNETQSGEQNKQADSVPATKSDSKVDAKQGKEKFGSRYEQRKQEMQAIRDEIRKEREELSRIRQTQNPAQQQVNGERREVEIIPKPTPPKYSKEDLTKWYKEAQEKGDATTARACIDGLQEWKDHETNLKFWNIENGQKFKDFEKAWTDNWTKATTKFPDLKDKNSELYKEADKMARKYPEILNRKAADGQYVIAQVAAMRLKIKNHDSVVGALEEKLKSVTEKLESYQKRAQPASQGTKPNLSKPNEGKTPEERLAAKLGVA